MTPPPPTIHDVLRGSPYRGYLYSYPHKTAYRPLDPPRDLRRVWADERRDALFLYLHVPFCEMRCGFCNLFTTPKAGPDPVEAYVSALERQARVVARELGPASFARLAIGGGTPTYLPPALLHRLFDVAEHTLGVNLAATPVSVETSPETGDRDRLAVLAERGVDRVSMGVQSFDDGEVRRLGRPQRAAEVLATIERIRALGFRRLNLDLMYGIADQTVPSFLRSIDRAVGLGAQEIYLYPLYVRPRTGLGPQAGRWDDERLTLYRAGRARLLEAGYRQASMRMFERPAEGGVSLPRYRCQEDGMLGLGVGARSYTAGLHYASDYAVGRGAVRRILAGFVAAPDAHHAQAHHGVALGPEDQRRRYVILSLLEADRGLDLAAYEARFGSRAEHDLPVLAALVDAGAAIREEPGWLRLTPLGVERSDAIGPWLRSARVRELMEAYDLR